MCKWRPVCKQSLFTLLAVFGIWFLSIVVVVGYYRSESASFANDSAEWANISWLSVAIKVVHSRLRRHFAPTSAEEITHALAPLSPTWFVPLEASSHCNLTSEDSCWLVFLFLTHKHTHTHTQPFIHILLTHMFLFEFCSSSVRWTNVSFVALTVGIFYCLLKVILSQKKSSSHFVICRISCRIAFFAEFGLRYEQSSSKLFSIEWQPFEINRLCFSFLPNFFSLLQNFDLPIRLLVLNAQRNFFLSSPIFFVKIVKNDVLSRMGSAGIIRSSLKDARL